MMNGSVSNDLEVDENTLPYTADPLESRVLEKSDQIINCFV
jgi:hypothetical protein